MIDTESIRKKILDLALCGKLTEQREEDGDVTELVKEIQSSREKLIKKGIIKKEKEFACITEEDALYEIPSSWTWMRVSEIAYLTSGKPYEEVNNGELFIKVSDMNIPGNATSITTSEHFVSENNSGRIPKYSIIFPKRGGAIATNKKRIVVEREIYIDLNTMGMTVIKPEIFPYVKVWFDSMKLDELQTGTSIPQINNKDIYPLLIPIPPLKEQKRIVHLINEVEEKLSVIDEFQTMYEVDREILKSKLIDAGIQGKLTEQLPEDGTAEELLEQIAEEKKALEDAGVYKNRKKVNIKDSIQENEIFEIPTNWKWVRLGQLADVYGRIGFRGYTKADLVEAGEGAISMSPSNITFSGEIVFENNTYITWEKYDESPEIMVNEGDVLIVKTGSSFGKAGIIKEMPEKCTINPQLAIIKNILCDRYYLNLYLKSSHAWGQYKNFVIGAATPTFSQEKLANMLIPLPPIDEQKRIVNRMNEIFAAI